MNPLRSTCLPSASISTKFLPAVRVQLPIRTFTTCTALSAQRQMNTQQKSASDKAKAAKLRRKKKKHAVYKMPDMNVIKQYTLCDAMQHIKAFEVGRDPSTPKYDLAIRLKTKKDGPVLRNQVRLPWAVKTDIRVCVLVDPNSKAGKQAKEAGAYLVGLDEVFEQVKAGKIDFERCITIPENLPTINKAGMPRILGPRGLMPSVKLGTVTENVSQSVKNMMGGSTYRERQGVIRMAVGQLGFSAEQLRDNVKTFLGQVKKEAGQLAEANSLQKDVFEVVLSSTNSPGFSLNGEFRTADSISAHQLAIA